MKHREDDQKYAPSRRDFIRLATAGAGVVTTLAACRHDIRAADARGVADCGPAAADSSWMAGSPEIMRQAQAAHQTLSLNGAWSVVALPIDVEGEGGYRVLARHTGERLQALVPGEIHLDLMRAGRMEDPSVSDNARTRCRWPEEHSWWYRTEFEAPKGFRQQVRQQLIFDGIDLYAQVFVNGTLAGTAKNAFVAATFDVKRLLNDGRNELVVRVTSGMELASRPTFVGEFGAFFLGQAKLDDFYSVRSWDQQRPLRKPHYATHGFDFSDPLPNIGIWRGVRLEGRTDVLIHYLRLDTVIRGKEVFLEGEITVENLHPWSEIPCVLELRLAPPQGEPIVQHLSYGATIGRTQIPCRIVVPNAQLWWPNGMGGQPLYRLTARVICGTKETDRVQQTLGLRTLKLDRAPLPGGSRFCLKVNGQDVYCKGGNWAPGDLIAARVDGAHYEKLVAEARNAHFTMLRVCGVGVYENDEFYDACDRAGILVWQDFAFACAMSPDQDPEFVASVRDEAEAVVKRLRHHAALALWCGNNECALSMGPIWKSDPTKPEEIGGVRLYSEVLPDICHFHDPGRPYWPSSPSGGAEPNSETSGDVHGVNVDKTRARFVTEYYAGFGPPHMASIGEYLKPQERFVGATAWKVHVNAFANGPGTGALLSGIRENYGEPEGLSLPQFVLYGQMSHAKLHAEAVEALRFRKADPEAECQGSLMWSFNETWGEVGWAIIDHYFRRKASYYAFKRGAAPVKVLVRPRDGHLVTRVVNDTLRKFDAVVRCGWMRLDGSVRELRTYVVSVPANGMLEIARMPVPPPAERDLREWLYAATLSGKGIAKDQAIWLSAPHRQRTLPKPAISIAVQDRMLTVSSPVYCHGVHLDDEGSPVLADNYFDLLPGIPRHISVIRPMASGAYPLKAVMPIARGRT